MSICSSDSSHTLFEFSVQLFAFKRLLRSESLVLKQSCLSLCGCNSLSHKERFSLQKQKMTSPDCLSFCNFTVNFVRGLSETSIMLKQNIFAVMHHLPLLFIRRSFFIESLRPEIYYLQVCECKSLNSLCSKMS